MDQARVTNKLGHTKSFDTDAEALAYAAVRCSRDLMYTVTLISGRRITLLQSGADAGTKPVPSKG